MYLGREVSQSVRVQTGALAPHNENEDYTCPLTLIDSAALTMSCSTRSLILSCTSSLDPAEHDCPAFSNTAMADQLTACSISAEGKTAGRSVHQIGVRMKITTLLTDVCRFSAEFECHFLQIGLRRCNSDSPSGGSRASESNLVDTGMRRQ